MMPLFKRLGLTLGLALTLSACVRPVLTPGLTTQGPVGVVSSTMDEKALIAAETGFRVILIGVGAALDTNQLGPNDVPKVKAALIRAKAALDTARAAYAVGNVLQMNASIADANAIVGVVGALIGRI